MSVFNSWAPGDVFGESDVNNSNLNNHQYNKNINQKINRDQSVTHPIKAFDDWSPESIFGDCIILILFSIGLSNQPSNDNNLSSFVPQQPKYEIPMVEPNSYKSPKKPKPNTSPDLDSFYPNQINFNQNNNNYSNPPFAKPYSQPQIQQSPHPPIKYYNDNNQMEVLNSYDNNPISQSIQQQQQPIMPEENLPPDERPIKPMKQMNNIFKQQQPYQQHQQQSISPLTCNTDNTDYPPRKSLNPSPSPGKKYLFNSDYPPHQSPQKSPSPSPSPKKSFLFHHENKNNNNNKRIKTPVIPEEELDATHLNYSFDRPLHLADSSKFPAIKSKKPPTPTPVYDNDQFDDIYQSPIQSPPAQSYYQPSPPKQSSPPPPEEPSPIQQYISPFEQQPPQNQQQQSPQPQQQYSPYQRYSPLQQISPLQFKKQQNSYQNNETEDEIKPNFGVFDKTKKKKKKIIKTKSPTKSISMSSIRNALEEERKKMKVVLAIQSLYRMRKERKLYKDIIDRKVAKRKRINLKKRKKAALVIQRAYRRHLQLLYEAIIRERKRHVKCGNCGSTEANGLYCKKCGYRIKQNNSFSNNKKNNDNKSKLKNNNNKLNSKAPKTTTSLPKIKIQTKGVRVNKKDDRKNNNSPIQVPKSYKAIRNEVKSYKKEY